MIKSIVLHVTGDTVEDTVSVIQSFGLIVHAVPEIELEELANGELFAVAEYRPQPDDIVVDDQKEDSVE
jgi:hypothetical protein